MQTTVRITIDVLERSPRRPSILVLSADREGGTSLNPWV
jgi:hypothetical protein